MTHGIQSKNGKICVCLSVIRFAFVISLVQQLISFKYCYQFIVSEKIGVYLIETDDLGSECRECNFCQKCRLDDV